MLIMALDAATRTGFAIGEAGSRPRTGVVRLKRPDEDAKTAWFNMLAWLDDQIAVEKPDLIAFEAPLPMVAQKSADASAIAWGAYAITSAMARRCGIQFREVDAQKVSRHFTGKGWWSAQEGGRKAKKAATIARAHLLGLLDRSCVDEDRADACAVFDYASAVFARKRPAEVVLFGSVA